jgi:hypothetical protein
MINEQIVKYLKEVMFKSLSYKNGTIALPLIAQKFIEIGYENGITFDIDYGIKQVDENMDVSNNGILNGEKNYYVGYYITAIEKNKRIFIGDVHMEDESEENISTAIDFINEAIINLKS